MVWQERMTESPRISARACIRRDGRILLSKYKDHRGYWYVMPGGGQRAGETLEECLQREVHEELGVPVRVHGMMFVREIIADRHKDKELPVDFHQVEVIFDCSLPDGAEPALGGTLDPDQVGHEWIELSKLKDYLFFPVALADRISDPDLLGKYLGEIR
jgi:8-oxo-dGTP pyrophosphatase MutT (NUDIX family)